MSVKNRTQQWRQLISLRVQAIRLQGETIQVLDLAMVPSVLLQEARAELRQRHAIDLSLPLETPPAPTMCGACGNWHDVHFLGRGWQCSSCDGHVDQKRAKMFELLEEHGLL